MKGYLTFTFGKEAQAEFVVSRAARRAWTWLPLVGRAPFEPPKATDADFLVEVSKQQVLTLRHALNDKGFKKPADFRSPFWYKRASRRQNIVREFMEQMFEGQSLAPTLMVPLPFWKSLVEKTIQSTEAGQRPRLRKSLERFMLPADDALPIDYKGRKNAHHP